MEPLARYLAELNRSENRNIKETNTDDRNLFMLC